MLLEVSMKMIKILISSLVLITTIHNMDQGKLLAKHDRTDQDYSDKHFTPLSYVENPHQDGTNTSNDGYNNNNNPYASGTQHQTNQGYNNQNYTPRDVNANKQLEAADWAEQMKVRDGGNYPSNAQYYYQTPSQSSYSQQNYSNQSYQNPNTASDYSGNHWRN